MNTTRVIIGVIICAGALFSGVTVGLAMGGFGICAVDFSPSLVIYSVLLGAVLSGFVAFLWRSAWWVGALIFSAPAFVFGTASGESQRVIGICACIVGSMLAAFIVRYPSRGSLKL